MTTTVYKKIRQITNDFKLGSFEIKKNDHLNEEEIVKLINLVNTVKQELGLYINVTNYRCTYIGQCFPFFTPLSE